MTDSVQNTRFEVSFSFAGPHRDKVRGIAEIVANNIGREKVFFDEWYEHEILGDDMDVLLQRIYHTESLMVVADLSSAYADRAWTQAEARAIRALRFDLDPARDETGRLRLLNARFGEGEIPGSFKTAGYLDGINKSAEQCADLILRRLALFKQRAGINAGLQIVSPSDVQEELVVNDSGKWVMIGSSYFMSDSVRQASNRDITVCIPSHDAEDDALVAALAPSEWQQSVVEYAYRHDALIVRVQNVESESKEGNHVWLVTLQPEDVTYGGGFMTDIAWSSGDQNYTAQEIVELRARRLLLNDPPGSSESAGSLSDRLDDSLDAIISGIGIPFSADECVFPKLYEMLKGDPRRFMQIARLKAIFALKAGQVFERVTELTLGPIKDGLMHVRCKGRRRQVYSNFAAQTMEIEGGCRVSSTS